MDYQEAFDKSCALRDEFWIQYGTLDPHFISFMINPGLTGGPQWPSLRQAFRVIHAESGTILASDGLSDPYINSDKFSENKNYNGVGLELYVRTHEKLSGSQPHNWQTKLLIEMSQQAAHMGDLITYIEENKYLSFELPNFGVPNDWLDNGQAGIFIGLEDSQIDCSVQLALESVKIVNLKLLRPAELQYAIANGAKGREHLAELFSQLPDPTVSSLDRQSVV